MLRILQVHAYERINRVYNYTLDPCGPIYITVGDGGNIEKVDVDHADEPGKCPSPGDNIPEFGGVCHSNFTFGPAKGNFCWNKQPEWSAFRESSFGHGILEVMTLTFEASIFLFITSVATIQDLDSLQSTIHAFTKSGTSVARAVKPS